MTLKLSSYSLSKFSTVSFTTVLILLTVKLRAILRIGLLFNFQAFLGCYQLRNATIYLRRATIAPCSSISQIIKSNGCIKCCRISKDKTLNRALSENMSPNCATSLPTYIHIFLFYHIVADHNF